MANKKKKKDKKKKPFNGSLIEGIQTVHFLYEKRLEKSFGKFDMSNEQYRILEILNSAEPEGLSLKQIRTSLPNQTSNATRLVEKLRGKKFLVKKNASLDKRELRISITEAGRQFLSDAQQGISELESDLNGSIKSKNASVFLDTLGKIANSFSKA